LISEKVKARVGRRESVYEHQATIGWNRRIEARCNTGL
jgi:hypothetical protein